MNQRKHLVSHLTGFPFISHLVKELNSNHLYWFWILVLNSVENNFIILQYFPPSLCVCLQMGLNGVWKIPLSSSTHRFSTRHLLLLSWHRHMRTRPLSLYLQRVLLLFLCGSDPVLVVNKEPVKAPLAGCGLQARCAAEVWSWTRIFSPSRGDDACLEWSLCGNNLLSPILHRYIIKKCGQYSPFIFSNKGS